MKVAELKMLFDNALILNVSIKNTYGYWVINIHRKNCKVKDAYQLLINDKGKTREFKTLDAAYNACRAIGIKNLEVLG